MRNRLNVEEKIAWDGGRIQQLARHTRTPVFPKLFGKQKAGKRGLVELFKSIGWTALKKKQVIQILIDQDTVRKDNDHRMQMFP